MDPVAEVFGRRVRALRKARGLTQEALAKSAGMDPKHIGAIERGAKTSSFDAIRKLAEALDADFYELFLPEDRSTAAVEKEVTNVLKQSARIDAENISEFLRALRSALRRLGDNSGA